MKDRPNKPDKPDKSDKAPVLLRIRCGRLEHNITENDRFLDNGSSIQLTSQPGPMVDWGTSYSVLPEREVRRIGKFERVLRSFIAQHEFGGWCATTPFVIFSLKRLKQDKS